MLLRFWFSHLWHHLEVDKLAPLNLHAMYGQCPLVYSTIGLTLIWFFSMQYCSSVNCSAFVTWCIPRGSNYVYVRTYVRTAHAHIQLPWERCFPAWNSNLNVVSMVMGMYVHSTNSILSGDMMVICVCLWSVLVLSTYVCTYVCLWAELALAKTVCSVVLNLMGALNLSKKDWTLDLLCLGT